jgi:ribosome-binding factor A
MESTRQKKVARLIQKELATIFLRESRNMFNNAFITVTVVRLSPDLGHARIYLSFFNTEKPAEILTIVQQSKREIRGKLGEQVGKQLRIVPEIDFFIDDSLDYYENIDRLLKND